MRQQLDALIEACRADGDLQAAIVGAGSPQEVVSIARASGFDVSTDDVLNLTGQVLLERDVTDAELEQAAGAGQMTRRECAVTAECPLVSTWWMC